MNYEKPITLLSIYLHDCIAVANELHLLIYTHLDTSQDLALWTD